MKKQGLITIIIGIVLVFCADIGKLFNWPEVLIMIWAFIWPIVVILCFGFSIYELNNLYNQVNILTNDNLDLRTEIVRLHKEINKSNNEIKNKKSES